MLVADFFCKHHPIEQILHWELQTLPQYTWTKRSWLVFPPSGKQLKSSSPIADWVTLKHYESPLYQNSMSSYRSFSTDINKWSKGTGQLLNAVYREFQTIMKTQRGKNSTCNSTTEPKWWWKNKAGGFAQQAALNLSVLPVFITSLVQNMSALLKLFLWGKPVAISTYQIPRINTHQTGWI